MADDFVQVAPDSTGKKIDNTTETTGAGSVERQRVSVAAAGSNNQLAIDASGNIGVSAVSATTITSIPSIDVTSMTAGTVTSSTITAALPAGTNVIGHVIVDSITAGTIGDAVITAGTISANQGTANATPWNVNVAQIGATTIAAVAKGTQAANALPVQNYIDSGRTVVVFNADRITGTTAETALTVTINKGGSTSSASTYAVTSGKTLRIQFAGSAVRSTATTVASGRVRLRSFGSTVTSTTAAPIWIALECSSIAALAESTGADEAEISDSMEFVAGTNISFSHIESSTACTESLNVIAFEY